MMGNAKSQHVRPPAVAGRFYPDNPVELRRLVEALLLSTPEPGAAVPKALIAPHAGYIYSGPIAASAYACLRASAESIQRVVLLGPSHFVALRGVAASHAQGFATPLGVVPVDLEALDLLLKLPWFSFNDEAHAHEHSLEVQLPFLQVALGGFKLVPLVVGDATTEEVAQVLNQLWGGDETRFVISSDLSHYLDWERARQIDHATAKAIESLAPEHLAEDQACGRVAICGLLHSAASHRLHARTVDLRTSGDTAGPKKQVVGYGAFIFAEAG